MPNGLLGKKLGMSHYFTPDGNSVAVTLIEAGPCTTLQVKTPEKDGYSAVQLGFDEKPKKSANKPEQGRFNKASSNPLRFIKEVAIDNAEAVKIGDKFFVDIFEQGDIVDISGVSIGKGFQGGMKRWHWRGGKRSHGSMFHRAPGSIQSGPRLTKVTPGHHLPGHMGFDQVTVQNLEVMEIDKDKNLIIVNGAVPGPDGNYLVIKKAKKLKKRSAQKPVEEKEQEAKKPEPKKKETKK